MLFVLSTLFGASILRYTQVDDGVMNLTFATPFALFGFLSLQQHGLTFLLTIL